MAWTNPRTWADAETVTAAIMNLHVRDNLNYLYDPGDWTAYTPTVTGFTSVVTTPTGYYQYVNRSTVAARVKIVIGTVTTLGSATITVSLPVNCKTTGYTANVTPIGSGVFDGNATVPYMALPTFAATGSFNVLVNAATAPQTSRWTGAAPAGQVAGDVWEFNLLYEAA